MEGKQRPIFLPSFLGFSIYDLVHLVCSSILLGFAYAHKEGDWFIEVAKSSAEIAFSLLLVAFTISMVRQRGEGEDGSVDKAYHFAWLTATAGQSLSASCLIPYLLVSSASEEIKDVEFTCFTSSIVLVIAAFICFFVALMLARKTKAKHVMSIIGMALIFLSIPLFVTGDCFYNHGPVERVLEIIIDIAPIFCIAGGLNNEIKELRFLRKK